MYISNELLYIGDRRLLPDQLKEHIVKMLHKTHMDARLIKQKARKKMYWIGINKDLEKAAKNSIECSRYESLPNKSDPILLEEPKEPFSRVHFDIDQFYESNTEFICATDSKTGYVDAKILKSKKSCDVIKFLQKIGKTFGKFDVIVADQGRYFTSNEFATYINSKKTQLLFCGTARHEANGLAESTVKILKECARKMLFHKKSTLYERKNIRYETLQTLNTIPKGTKPERPYLLIFTHNIDKLIKTKLDTDKNSKFEIDKIFKFKLPFVKEYKIGVISEPIGNSTYVITSNNRQYHLH
uniref:RNA-directed DNA polymerase n=1 Tax=Strongyloides venezuelensis TaxID=75913 RepID=A0A0K0FC97_STRVS